MLFNNNGYLHWLDVPPPKEIEKRHVMLVVDFENIIDKPKKDIRQLLAQTRGCIKPLRNFEEIDKEIVRMRSEWDREWEE